MSCGRVVAEPAERDATVAPTLAARLSRVWWLGGGSGAGKSTVSRRLADQYGLLRYDTDAVMAEHAGRCPPEHCPQLAAFLAMDMDQRWVHRSPQVMLETFHWFRGEGFPLIIEDLLGVPAGTPVLVEGFRLLPDLVTPLLPRRSHAVWLLPSPAFRREALTARGDLWTIAGLTSDPHAALRNLLERDRLFTERLRRQTRHLGLPRIDVDASVSEAELSTRVGAIFGL